MSRWHEGNKESLVREIESKFTGIWNHFASKCRHGRESLRKCGYKCSGCKEVKNIRRVFWGAVERVAGIIFILPMLFCIPSQMAFFFQVTEYILHFFLILLYEEEREVVAVVLLQIVPLDSKISHRLQISVIVLGLHNYLLNNFVKLGNNFILLIELEVFYLDTILSVRASNYTLILSTSDAFPPNTINGYPQKMQVLVDPSHATECQLHTWYQSLIYCTQLKNRRLEKKCQTIVKRLNKLWYFYKGIFYKAQP